jgi:thymidylate synthase (FAD)
MKASLMRDRKGNPRVNGDDDLIADVARVSVAKAADMFTDEENAKLIKYLVKHNHISPFHHPSLSIRMSAPVPIRTQCFKSKVGFAENEESRRYISTTPELYIPDHFRSRPEGSIKQGSGGVHPHSDTWRAIYTTHCYHAIDQYERMIQDGVAPEQARFILPQGVEVNWCWTGSLAAFARFVNLRKDGHAQAETQTLAAEVSRVIEETGRFAHSWKELTS